MDDDVKCLRLHKPCTCTYWCCNRPVIQVEYIENENEGAKYLGKVVDNFDFCNFSFSVYDAQDKKIMHIFTSCCQLGIMCQGYPCKACEKVDFQVFDSNGNEITKICKRGKDCLKNAIGDADNFGLEFPKSMGWEHRTLLMSAVLLIDFMMFEEKGNNRNQNRIGDL